MVLHCSNKYMLAREGEKEKEKDEDFEKSEIYIFFLHMTSFLHDIALVGICRWHGGLFLPTVVFGSITRPI